MVLTVGPPEDVTNGDPYRGLESLLYVSLWEIVEDYGKTEAHAVRRGGFQIHHVLV